MPQFNVMKNKLRREFAKRRNEISDKNNKDIQICRALLESNLYNNADELLCFYPINGEVNTFQIINTALNDGKKLCLPVCTAEKGIMDFYSVTSLEMLKTGKFSLPEPDVNVCERVDFFCNAVCIVPAYTYDYFGYRLGYGGGYYDRFLSDFKFPKIGVCYDELLYDALPKDEFDVKVDYVITDKRTFKASEEV